MTDDSTLVAAKAPMAWYEQMIPIRGCHLTLDNIKDLYRQLSVINRNFGVQVISTLEREPELDDAAWEERKKFLLEDAFALTVTIMGQEDQQHYGETIDIFSLDTLPKPVTKIYFTNITAWKRHASGSEPPNSLQVTIDFTKPQLFDPSPLVSEQTPNNSNVAIHARDMTYFRAVQRVVETTVLSHQTWYQFIHRNFAYDVGIWLLTLPFGLVFATYYMDRLLPIGGPYETYRWAFFIYAIGMALIVYRFLNAYAKWAFPVNVLEENKDTAWKHRLVLAGAVSWLFYKGVDIIYGLAIPLP